MDGDYINPKRILIDPVCFASRDLAAPFDVPGSYDLAICLEVARIRHVDMVSVLIFEPDGSVVPIAGRLPPDAPVTVGQNLGSGIPGMRTGGLPAAAIDPGTGNMYVVWQDARFNASGLNDIVLSASTDGGRKWSTPRAVNPEVAGLDRFTPAVAAAGGAVHVTYRTRGENGTAPTVTEDYIASANGGRTFGPVHQIGPLAVLQWAAVAGTRAFLGDYMGLAATPQAAMLAWCVSSEPPGNGSYHQTMWAARVSR